MHTLQSFCLWCQAWVDARSHSATHMLEMSGKATSTDEFLLPQMSVTAALTFQNSMIWWMHGDAADRLLSSGVTMTILTCSHARLSCHTLSSCNRQTVTRYMTQWTRKTLSSAMLLLMWLLALWLCQLLDLWGLVVADTTPDCFCVQKLLL